MSRLWKRYHRYMIRPILYQCATRLVVVTTLGLLWVRYINTNQEIALVDYVFPIAGLLLIAISWFDYLKLDGLSIGLKKKDTKPKKRFFFRSMIDDTQQDVTNLSSLDAADRAACMFLVNLITGSIFLLIAFGGTILNHG